MQTGEHGGQLAVEAVGDDRRYRLVGDLDILTAPSLLQALEPALRGSAGDITLDLSALEFVDSSGLSALLTVARNLSGARLVLKSARGMVARILDVTGIDRVENLLVEPDAD